MGTHKKNYYTLWKNMVSEDEEKHIAVFFCQKHISSINCFFGTGLNCCVFFLKLVFKGKTALLGLFESKLLLALYATAFSDVCSVMFVVAPYLEWHTGMFASLSINILTSVTSTPTEFIEIEKKKTAWRAILLLPIELVEVETVEIRVLVNHSYSSPSPEIVDIVENFEKQSVVSCTLCTYGPNCFYPSPQQAKKSHRLC